MTQTQQQTGRSERPSSVKAVRATPRGMTASGWQEFARLLKPAVDRQSDMTLIQCLEKCAQELFQMWILTDPASGCAIGAMTTKVVEYPSGLRVCVIVSASTSETDLEWASMRGVSDAAEEFARSEDCDVVRIHGRRGWQRVLEGYSESYVTLEKKVRGVH